MAQENSSLTFSTTSNNHTNAVWVNKAGLTYLEYVTQATAPLSLSCKDIIVIVKFISNMKAEELYNLHDEILYCLPDSSHNYDNLVKWDEETPVSKKQEIRALMNDIIYKHVQVIATYIKKYDIDIENKAIKSLIEYAIYANEKGELNHGKLIWEILREIANNIPQDPNNPYTPIEAKSKSPKL